MGQTVNLLAPPTLVRIQPSPPFLQASCTLVLRVWYNGRTSAFQADDASSILATRSILQGRMMVTPLLGLGGSGVEHILGKDEVAGSIPALGSSLVLNRLWFSPFVKNVDGDVKWLRKNMSAPSRT